ncbi:hypothetical protein; putative signal peptide [Frankia alni ACN14a]|uniref:Uncharacterized protein n=1 Tax=Frankia alni (strain DSM 45986 / CECT 9034 / ACN14a) TaxID=326424 RepID=Q0RIQ9_FRAAA|nr:hypothetical protein; putative signal peptide [Frankia alni ACN14a]
MPSTPTPSASSPPPVSLADHGPTEHSPADHGAPPAGLLAPGRGISVLFPDGRILQNSKHHHSPE